MVTTVQGLSGGAPHEACGIATDIVPNHAGISPSTDPIPYTVDLSGFIGGQYVPGDIYTSKNIAMLSAAIFLSWHIVEHSYYTSYYSNTFGRLK